MIAHWRLILGCSAFIVWVVAVYGIASRLQTMRRKYPKIPEEPLEWWK